MARINIESWNLSDALVGVGERPWRRLSGQIFRFLKISSFAVALLLVGYAEAKSESLKPLKPIPNVEVASLTPAQACKWFNQGGYDYWSARLDGLEERYQETVDYVKENYSQDIKLSIASEYEGQLIGSNNDRTDVAIAKGLICRVRFMEYFDKSMAEMLPMNGSRTEVFLATHGHDVKIGEIKPFAGTFSQGEAFQRKFATQNEVNLVYSVVFLWGHCMDDLEATALRARLEAFYKTFRHSYSDACEELVKY